MTPQPLLTATEAFAQIEERLRARRRRTLTLPGAIPAAVLAPLFEKDGAAHLLLTLRTNHVASHKGQISFPGGAVEEGDESLAETALRETFEEVGIRSKDVRIIGEMDDVPAVSDHVVTPIIGVIPHPYNFRVSADEIEELIEIPLGFFMDTANCRTEWHNFRGQITPIYYYQYGRHNVWGLTAYMIRCFLEVCFDIPREQTDR